MPGDPTAGGRRAYRPRRSHRKRALSLGPGTDLLIPVCACKTKRVSGLSFDTGKQGKTLHYLKWASLILKMRRHFVLQEYKYSLVKHSGISLQSTALTAEMLSILAAFAALCWGLNLRRAKCCTGGSSQSVAPCSSRVEHGGCRCACTAAAAVGAMDSTAAWYATHWTVACTTSAARLPSRWRLLKLSSRQLSRSWLESQI